MLTLRQLGRKLSSGSLTAADASQAVWLFRRLESKEGDPAKKASYAQSRKLFGRSQH